MLYLLMAVFASFRREHPVMKYLFLVFCMWVAAAAGAQDTITGSAIFEPINLLFTGMNLADSAMVRKAFMPDPTMATITKDRNGTTGIRYEDFDKFLAAVGSPRAQPWSEPLWDIAVQSDGNLAQVWAQYAFYAGKKFSHCGVDAFQLLKGDDGKWRIFFIADTRRTEGCEVPPAVSERFK